MVGWLPWILAAIVLLWAAHRHARRRGHKEAGPDLARELDRLENVLRRDPYRDDIRRLYMDLLDRAGPEERRRRESDARI